MRKQHSNAKTDGNAENGAIIQELRSMEMDHAQGYGVCKPTPPFEKSPEAHSLPQPAAAIA